jgi:exonuclease I
VEALYDQELFRLKLNVESFCGVFKRSLTQTALVMPLAWEENNRKILVTIEKYANKENLAEKLC